MSRLQLRLFGTFQLIREDGTAIDFRSQNERALLAYLAIEAYRPHSRVSLAGLLWPEQSDDIAHNNLRVTLHRLRQLVDDSSTDYPLLEVSRDAIQLSQTGQLWIDVSAFEELFSKAEQHPHEKLAICSECMARYAQAAVLYRGEYLQGVYPADSLPFSEWALLKREHLHTQALHALYLLAAYHQRRGELDLALGYARRQLELEPWREEAYVQIMTILALRGERSAALRHYERCRQVLRDELGVEPAEETRALYERILASRKRRRHNLPQQTTPFLGRKLELNQVSEYLANPDCRLLTVFGPGGIGKSRLVIQIAEAQVYSFLQGVYLVRLAGVNSVEEVIRAIATALDLQFHSASDSKAQLLDYLREKEMLLVLDNYEHLLVPGNPSSVRILIDLLNNAPGVRLLVTSRQRLNLSQEQVFILRGLSFPGDDFNHDPEKYESVQLFLHSARRIAPGFQPAKEEEHSVVRICQLLEGVPLAIELAAAWVWVMSPGQIFQEIQTNLDFLASSYPDLPERHRSLRATFEHSYNILTPEEQQALCRLSIFPASFDRIAAEQVAGATLAILTSLSNKSLLELTRINNRGSHFRYQMHELIKQFSSEKLAQVPAEAEQTRVRHCTFYMGFLKERDKNVMGGRASYQAVEEVSGEIDNVRLALGRAIADGHIDELGHSFNILMFFYEIQGLFEEAEQVFGKIRRRLEEIISAGKAVVEDVNYCLGRAMMYHGWYCMRLARYDQAIKHTQQGLDLSQQSCDLEGYGLGLNSLGVIAISQGKYQQAKSYLQGALKVLSENGYIWSQAGALSNLGFIAVLEGDLPFGSDLLSQSLDIYTQLDDEWGMANNLEDLGDIALRRGNLELAEKRIRQSLAHRQKLGQRWKVAVSMNKLGEVAYRRQQYAEAKRSYREGIAILQDFGERLHLASTLALYGEVCTILGENAHARESLMSSLRLAQEIGAESTVLRALLGMAVLLAEEGVKERSVEILVAISEHPSLEHDDKKRVGNLLDEIQAVLPLQIFQIALETGRKKDLENLVWDISRFEK